MAVKLYNTLTRQVEELTTIEPGKVRMYVCGPTVYNYFHIGNARAFVVFDTIRRYLKYGGYDVTYVQNFTDVDDKMIQRAAELDVTVLDVAKRYIEAYFKDADALGIERADVHPRVTENIPQIIAMIETLIARGHAYASDGDVYYATESFPDYGKLSHQPLADLQAGSRVEVSEKKQNPLDFALWKAAKPGEIEWDSPWGSGRPGWHIECSAMSRRYLGEQIDIHAGGSDLVFPHHENEIAQSEGSSGCTFSTYWLHNGFININNEKMSKSLGNSLNVHDLLKEYPAHVLRFFLLSVHYRNPINFSPDIMDQCTSAVGRIETCLTNLRHRLPQAESSVIDEEDMQVYYDTFETAMNNDFNTADALTALFDAVRDANTYLRQPVVSAKAVQGYVNTLETLGRFFGVLPLHEETDDSAKIEELVKRRTDARKNRDFKTADQIRQQLDDQGIVVEDTPHGPRWYRK